MLKSRDCQNTMVNVGSLQQQVARHVLNCQKSLTRRQVGWENGMESRCGWTETGENVLLKCTASADWVSDSRNRGISPTPAILVPRNVYRRRRHLATLFNCFDSLALCLRLGNVISRHWREHISAMVRRNFEVSLTGGCGESKARLLYDSSLSGEC